MCYFESCSAWCLAFRYGSPHLTVKPASSIDEGKSRSLDSSYLKCHYGQILFELFLTFLLQCVLMQSIVLRTTLFPRVSSTIL